MNDIKVLRGSQEPPCWKKAILLPFAQARESYNDASALAACLVQARSRSTGCKLTKAETTQCYGPIWMSELCSMCGKMAAVQRLESFIFWWSLEDNCCMRFTEIPADWFHLHRASTGRRRGGEKYWSISALPDILVSLVFLAPLNEIVPLLTSIWFLPGPFHTFRNKCHIYVFSYWGSHKLKVERFVSLSFRSLTCFP